MQLFSNFQIKTKYQNGNAGTNCTENDDPMNESLGDLDDLEDEEDQQKGPPKLFIMNLVNSYGNAQLEQLENDGQSLQITSKKLLSSITVKSVKLLPSEFKTDISNP